MTANQQARALFIGGSPVTTRGFEWLALPSLEAALERLQHDPSAFVGVSLLVVDAPHADPAELEPLMGVLPSPVRVRLVPGDRPPAILEGDAPFDLEVGREVLAQPSSLAWLEVAHAHWRGHWTRAGLPWVVARTDSRWVVLAGTGCPPLLGGRMPVGDLAQFLDLPPEAWEGPAWRGAARAWNGELLYVTTERVGHEALFITLSSDVRVGAQLSKQLQQIILSQAAVLLAHEVATPLSAVRTTLAVALDNADEWPPERRSAALEGALREIRRLERMVGSYLSLGRRRSLVVHVDSLASLIASTTADMRSYLQELGIELEVEPVPGTYRVRIGRDEFRQIVWNLVKNAADAVLEAGVEAPRIRMRVSSGAQEVSFLVEDNGPGIDEPSAEQLFEPFLSSKLDAGTGIGLALSRLIARRFGASITVAARDEGGTTACLQMPLASDSDEPSANG